MVSVTKPEDSAAEHDAMTKRAEAILDKLGIPYRTVVLCTGDLGAGMRKTHDIEVWLPGQNAYREIASISVAGDYQARRMNARFKPAGGGKPEYVHTLNGSGLAVGRCLIAVVEKIDGGKYEARKHIAVRVAWLREVVATGIISVAYIDTADQVADAMTKALPQKEFEKHRASMMNLPGVDKLAS